MTTGAPTTPAIESGESAGKNKNRGKKKFILIICILALLLVLLAGALVIDKRRQDSPKSHTTQALCTDTTFLSHVSTLLVPSKTASLKAEVDKIKAQDNYKSHQDCLTVVTTYYVSLGDYDEAKSHLGALEKVYDTQTPSKLGSNAKTIEVLRGDIEFLKQQKENAQGSIIPSERVVQ